VFLVDFPPRSPTQSRERRPASLRCTITTPFLLDDLPLLRRIQFSSPQVYKKIPRPTLRRRVRLRPLHTLFLPSPFAPVVTPICVFPPFLLFSSTLPPSGISGAPALKFFPAFTYALSLQVPFKARHDPVTPSPFPRPEDRLSYVSPTPPDRTRRSPQNIN